MCVWNVRGRGACAWRVCMARARARVCVCVRAFVYFRVCLCGVCVLVCFWCLLVWCVGACVRSCVRACVWACVRVCLCACVSVCVCAMGKNVVCAVCVASVCVCACMRICSCAMYRIILYNYCWSLTYVRVITGELLKMKAIFSSKMRMRNEKIAACGTSSRRPSRKWEFILVFLVFRNLFILPTTRSCRTAARTVSECSRAA